MTGFAAVVLFSLVMFTAGLALGLYAASRVPWRAILEASRAAARPPLRPLRQQVVSDEDELAASQEMAYLHEAFGAHLATCGACKSGHRCDVWLRSFC